VELRDGEPRRILFRLIATEFLQNEMTRIRVCYLMVLSQMCGARNDTYTETRRKDSNDILLLLIAGRNNESGWIGDVRTEKPSPEQVSFV